MNKKLLLALLSVWTIALQAQNNYTSGTIVHHNGDSLQGFVNDKDWIFNPTEIAFKITENATKQVLLPKDIRSLYVNGRKYVGKTFSYDASPIETKDLDTSAKAMMTEQSAFVEVIFEGPKKLYYYRDKAAKRHFFIEEGDTLNELVYRKYLRKDKYDRDVIGTVEIFRNQLLVYLNDCSSIGESIIQTEYKMSDMHKLFNTYYACQPHADFKVFKQTKSPIHGYFAGGLTYTNMQINGPSAYFGLSGAEMTNSVNPFGMIGISFALPRKLSRMSIKVDVSYLAFQSTAYTSRYQAALDYWINDEVYFDMAYINANLLFEYKYQFNAMSVFGSVGFSYGYALKDENRVKSFETSGSPFPPGFDTNPDTDLDITKNSQQGLLFGVGLSYNIVFLEYRYLYSNGMITTQGLGSEVGASHFALGLRLKLR